MSKAKFTALINQMVFKTLRDESAEKKNHIAYLQGYSSMNLLPLNFL